jgi:hypothetical protein
VSAKRDHDVVVYGATSFVGQILCRYLVRRHGTDGAAGSLRWAIAGRDASKLERVASETGADVPRLVADATPIARRSTRSRRRVGSSCRRSGRMPLHGSELVASVVDAGADYCDLTGEVQWMRRMIDAHQARAEETGARIVHACGFDSIPSDLGTWFTQQRAIEEFGEPCVEVRMSVKGAKGGVSGGNGREWHADVRGAGRGSRTPQGGRRSVRARADRSPSRSEAAGDGSSDPRRPLRELGGTVRDGADELGGGVARSRAARPAVGAGLHLRRDDDDRRRAGRRGGGVGDGRRPGRVRRGSQFRPDPQGARQGDPEARQRSERGQAAGRVLRPALRRDARRTATRSAPR